MKLTQQPQSLSCQGLSCLEILGPPPTVLSLAGLRYIPRQPAWECCFSYDGMFLAVAHGTGAATSALIRIWKKVNNDDEEWFLHSTLSGIHDRTIRSVSFAPGCYRLASASFDGTVAIWELSNGEWISTAQLEGPDTEVKCVRWNSTGSLLASCGRDKTIWIWECSLVGNIGGDEDNEFECLSILNGHEADIKSLLFVNVDSIELLISASYDDSIKIWMEDGGDWYCAKTFANIHSSTIWSLAVSHDHQNILAASQDGSISIYSIDIHQKTNNNKTDTDFSLVNYVGLIPKAHSEPIYCVQWSPFEETLFASCGGDGRIHIWQQQPASTTFAPLVQVVTDHGDVNCVAWHPRQKNILASVGDDGLVRLWKLQIPLYY